MIDLSFINDIDNYETRKIGRTEVGGLIVSTCYTFDGGYETAILDDEGAHPVQRYANKKEATLGHSEWLKKAPKIKRIRKLGMPGYDFDEKAGAEIITLKRRK